MSAWNALTGAIQGAIDKLLQFIGLKPSAPATGGGAPGKARGGLLSGRGTGTSDSNLAWLSRGEYVMPARAVRQPGVLGFLEALRRSSGGILGYAKGGSVGANSADRSIEPFTRVFDAIDAANKSNLKTMYDLSQSILAAGTAMDRSLLGIQNALERAINSLQSLLGAQVRRARGGLLGGRGTGTSDSNLAWLSRGEYVMPARAVRQPGVLGFLEALRRSGRIPGFAAGGLVSGGGTSAVTFRVDQMLEAIERNTQAIASMADAIIQLGGIVARLVGGVSKQVAGVSKQVDGVAQEQQRLRTEMKNAFPEVGPDSDVFWEELFRRSGSNQNTTRGTDRMPLPFGGGGLLGGRGTGTSDSNLAWLSRGEHIMPARAVSRPGVLAFLEALRRSGGNLSQVLDGMGRFALGGMVPRAIPAFAAGGLAGGMSNVTIQFPGLPEIGGLRASSGAVDELRKAAALAQVRSGGRKPSRYS